MGGGKLSCRGNMSPGPLEAVFFGPQIGALNKCSGGPEARLMQSRHIHQEICALLLGSIESLKTTLNEFYTVLPPHYNNLIGSPPFKNTDTVDRLTKLVEMAKVSYYYYCVYFFVVPYFHEMGNYIEEIEKNSRVCYLC